MINLLDGFPFLVVELGSRKDVLVWLGEDGGEDWDRERVREHGR